MVQQLILSIMYLSMRGMTLTFHIICAECARNADGFHSFDNTESFFLGESR
jgi:hypothetical protein